MSRDGRAAAYTTGFSYAESYYYPALPFKYSTPSARRGRAYGSWFYHPLARGAFACMLLCATLLAMERRGARVTTTGATFHPAVLRGLGSPRLSTLLFFAFVPTVSAVCTSCYGAAAGCTGDRTTCPWVTVVAANAAAIGTGAALVVTGLLSTKVIRLFPKSVLEAISACRSVQPCTGAD